MVPEDLSDTVLQNLHKPEGTLKNSKSALIRTGKVEENRQVTKTAIQLVGYFARFPLSGLAVRAVLLPFWV